MRKRPPLHYVAFRPTGPARPSGMAASGAWDGAAEMAMMYYYARARRIRVVLLIQTALLICASVLTSKYSSFCVLAWV